MRKIGEGSFGEVFELEHKNGTKFALKRSKSKDCRDNKWLERCCKEVAVLTQLEHSNIVRFYKPLIEESNGGFCIMMEYCDFDLHKAFEDEDLTREKIRPRALQLYGQIIRGLEYLHGKRIVHRDLKPANIFLCQDKDLFYTAKIGDFGLACYQDLTLTRGAGTPLYRAPEQLSREYGCLVDLYASGLIFFELLAMQKSYVGQRGDWQGVLQCLRLPYSTEHVLEEFDADLQGMKDLLMKLLDHTPEKRPPTAKDVQEELNNLKKDKNGKLLLPC